METMTERTSYADEVAKSADISEAGAAHHRLMEALDKLSAMTSHLEDRLSWVLSPTEPRGETGEAMVEPAVSPLTATLNSTADHVETVTGRLDRLARRIDVP